MADFEIKTTTALRKITGALLRGKRILGIPGGQGAGKTYSVLQLLINNASSKKNREIYIASFERSKMKTTVIKDFINILKAFDIYDKNSWNASDYLYTFSSGSTIKFLCLDKDDVGKGLRSDLVYVNEANKISFEAYIQLASRSERVIIDFNPDKEFWYHEEVQNLEETETLTLTFLDNEFLKKGERDTILSYKEKGFDNDGNVKNEYWANRWRVYGLGLIGRSQGAIFQNWTKGKFDNTLPYAYGLDFGSSDPDAMVKVAVDNKNKKIYIKEVIYQNNLSTRELADLVKQRTDKNKLIIADSQAKRTIGDLETYGLNIKPVSKNKIVEDIKVLQSFEIIVDNDSPNLERELNEYVWLDRKSDTPSEKNNHLLDAWRYACTLLVVSENRKKSKVL